MKVTIKKNIFCQMLILIEPRVQNEARIEKRSRFNSTLEFLPPQNYLATYLPDYVKLVRFISSVSKSMKYLHLELTVVYPPKVNWICMRTLLT